MTPAHCRRCYSYRSWPRRARGPRSALSTLRGPPGSCPGNARRLAPAADRICRPRGPLRSIRRETARRTPQPERKARWTSSWLHLAGRRRWLWCRRRGAALFVGVLTRHVEFHAAVQGVRQRIAALDARLRGAEATCGEPLCRDAVGDQEVHHRFRALLTQALVELLGAAFIRVSIHADRGVLGV